MERGTIFGLVGSDGAGKSTLLRMIATMIKPASGDIRIDGLDVVSAKRQVKPLIGYMPQRFGLYQDLTVEENIDFFMDIFGIRGKERKKRKERYLGFSNLLPFLDRLAGNLSGGMKQKLGLACVLVHEPQLLILDEPTNGVDPVSRQEFWDILSQMRRERHDHPGLHRLSGRRRKVRPHRTDAPRTIAGRRRRQRRSGQHFATLEEAMIARIQAVDKELVHDTFKR